MGISQPRKSSKSILYDTRFVRTPAEAVEANESRTAKAKVAKKLLSHFIEESKYPKKVENSQQLTSRSNTDEEPEIDDDESLRLEDDDEELILTPELASRLANIFAEKKPKGSSIKLSAHIYYPYQLMAFVDLLETSPTKQFLDADQCKIFADKYLLAMVFTYFVRADFDLNEFTEENFFAALLLAHDIEEENDLITDYMVSIWDKYSVQKNGEKNFIPLRRLRFDLFVRLGFRALVSRRCIEEAISLCPDLYIWNRNRKPTHSGTRRTKNDYKIMRLVFLDSQSHGNAILPNYQCQECLKLDLANVHSSLSKGKQNAIATRLSLKKRLNQREIAAPIKGEKKLKQESALDE